MPMRDISSTWNRELGAWGLNWATRQVQMSQQHLPSASAGLDDISVERRVGQREVLGVLAEQFGKDRLALVARRVLVNVAVHETIHQSRVSVDVNVEVQVNVLQESNMQLVKKV